MALPFININSITYSTGVLSVNADYQHLRGGGSVSITGLPSVLYYSKTFSYAAADIATFSISLSASTVYSLTFSFYKGAYINYPFDQPNRMGMSGGVPFNSGIEPYPNAPIAYEIIRTYPNYLLNT